MGRRSTAAGALASVLCALAACTAGAPAAAPPADTATSTDVTTPPSTTSTTTTTTSRTTAATTTTSTISPSTTSTSTTSTTSTSTSTTTSTTVVAPPADPTFSSTVAAFESLRAGNVAVSLSVVRAGAPVLGLAAGTTVGGTPVTSDTPFVIASVSKVLTALTVGRLAAAGRVDLAGPVPWTAMGLAHDPAWDTVTVAELLAHTSGMPIDRGRWTGPPGSCATPLEEVLARPPRGGRGTWVYSNGNYCALGLLVEHVTGEPLDVATDRLVLAPAGVTGPHLTVTGLDATDAPHPAGIGRLDRLGGAGTWVASTDDVATVLAKVTEADLEALRFPGVQLDQHGWGHTGTIDGAKACAWVLEGGRTVVVAVVSGDRPSSGGRVCDRVVPAVARDVGVAAGEPVRAPG